MSASLEKGVNALKQQVDSTVAAFFSSCVHCGMCADACLFYTEMGIRQQHPFIKPNHYVVSGNRNTLCWAALEKCLA